MVQWLAHLRCTPGDAGSIPTHGIKCIFIRKGSVSSFSVVTCSLFTTHIYVYIYVVKYKCGREVYLGIKFCLTSP